MYYLLKKPFDGSGFGITAYPQLPDNLSMAFYGEFFDQKISPSHLVFEVNYTLEIPPPDYISGKIKILSDNFINALKEVGVQNIQTYSATLFNPDTGDKWEHGYKAVNFVGIVDCVDVEKSSYDETGAGALAFNNMVIDQSKAEAHLCFHVPQAISQIIFSEQVVDDLIAKFEDLSGIDFVELDVAQ